MRYNVHWAINKEFCSHKPYNQPQNHWTFLRPAYINQQAHFIPMNEVIAVDTSTETIKELFYRQIKDLTLKGKVGTFDYQFSERWIQ